MATKTFKIGLSNTDKQNMAQDVYERLLALTFPEYDSAESYEVGDFVVYNDQLYKCIGATSGAWDSTKWQLATLNDLLTDIESAVAFVNDKANVDGNYPTMTVGAADNLTPYSEDAGRDQEQPFLFQGTGCGNGEQQVDTGALALLKSKNGNSVVVNQQLDQTKLPSTQTSNGITLTNNGDGTLTFSGTASGNANFYTIDQMPFSNKSSHKFLIIGATNKIRIYDGYGGSSNTGIYILTPNADANAVYYQVQDGTDLTTPETIKPLIIDLTQWFGSNDNIPDGLLEQDGAKNFFRYYQGSLAYNTGTLVNSNGRYLKTIGRQQWDEEWENGYIDDTTGENVGSQTQYLRSKNYIRVIPNATYYFLISHAGKVYFYDKDKNYIKWENSVSNNTFTIPSNACYMRFWCNYDGTYANDITISIYYDGESGYDQYYPYEELANIDTGNEVLRSAGSAKDSKAPDGTITRRVGTYTFTGSEVWFTRSYGATNCDYYCVELSIEDDAKTDLLGEVICSNGYLHGNAYSGNTPGLMGIDSRTLYVAVPTGANPNTVFASGVILNYELATPTTKQGTAFSENVAIDDFGSMDFAAANGVPQGAALFYAVDYKAFIDTLYNTLDGDATDIVKESELDSKLATLGYVKLTSVTGYDATKTQTLKNVEGTFTWVDDE